MLLFIIYWLLALALAFSFNLILGFYWYQHLLNKFNNFKNLSNSELFFFQDKYFNYLDISIWWFLLFSTFLIGIYSGWILEKKINILEKINLFWQKKQPEFYKRTKGEIRSLLPWLLISLPILITLIINILILVNFQLYTFLNLTISCLILGFIFGQLIVSITMYKETINLDRPFKEAEAPIKKSFPIYQKKYLY